MKINYQFCKDEIEVAEFVAGLSNPHQLVSIAWKDSTAFLVNVWVIWYWSK